MPNSLQQCTGAVRRFNRFYTRQIGVLRKNYLDSPYSLGEMRVLYELAHGGATTASDIGRALDLDAGYLSRVLRSFEKRGFISRKPSRADARQSDIALTARGAAHDASRRTDLGVVDEIAAGALRTGQYHSRESDAPHTSKWGRRF